MALALSTCPMGDAHCKPEYLHLIGRRIVKKFASTKRLFDAITDFALLAWVCFACSVVKVKLFNEQQKDMLVGPCGTRLEHT